MEQTPSVNCTRLADGQKWRVAYALLHRVVDATPAEPIAGQIIKR